MGEIEYLCYDENVDHLTIYKADEKIVANVDTGLVIVNLNKNKEIVGLEFMGAHKNFRIPLEVLKGITGCNVDIRYNPERKVMVVTVCLKYKKEEMPLTYSTSMDLGEKSFSEQFACTCA